MKEVINGLYVKSSNKLIVRRINGKLIVENNSYKREKIIFTKTILTNRNSFVIQSDIKTLSGGECQLKLLSRKLEPVQNITANNKVYFALVPKLTFIGVAFEPYSKYEINSIKYNINKNESDDLEKFFVNDTLVLCPGYPSDDDKYNCSFIHSRVSEYSKHKINVDVAVVNELQIDRTEFYEFENQKVCRTGYNQIRLLLLRKKYKKILIHFPSPEYFHILDAVDIRETQVCLCSHGSDTLYYDFNLIGSPYFTNDYRIPESFSKKFVDRDAGIKKYNERPNFKFIFVTDWNRKYSERLLDIKYKNYDIVPCFIDDKLFSYKKKDSELRKKVFVIRPQKNLKSYSVDLDVRVILELSHRECFRDMEFSIYGDGELHDKLVKPLEKFENVHIFKGFLTHEQIAEMHKNNGIGLFATRFDNQAVSACEAAMSGCAVVTSKGIGAIEYVNPNLGTYCETENYIEYADVIEKLYNDEEYFQKVSREMHDYAYNTCSFEHSLKKDVDIIKNFNDVEKIEIPTIKKHPLLTISISSYNISSFVIQVVCSLLRSKYADELEILVVNDGSKDDTVSKINSFIKNNYKGKGKPIIKVIDKENGGHGSTINAGIAAATGKYFRLLDGDDYYVSENLDKFIEKLREEDSDLVLSNYIEDFSVSGEFNRKKMYEELTPFIKYRLNDITYDGYGFSEWGPLLSTSTYKTQILKESNFLIDEKCFYVDQEYNLIGILFAETVTYYPYDIYSYYLGRAGQSVSPESYKRNVKHHEKVCIRLIEEYMSHKDELLEGKDRFIVEKLIIPMCKTQYDIVLGYFNDTKNFKSFDKQLKKYPELYNNSRYVGRRMKLYRKMPFMILVAKVVDKLLRKR